MPQPLAPIPGPEKEGAIEPDYDQRIHGLRKYLEDVQNPETLVQRTGRQLLAHADLVVDILEAVQNTHSVVAVAVIPFKITLKVVRSKQDNDKRVVALILEMIEMMSALVELHPTQEKNRETATKETIQTNLTRVLEEIKVAIREAGILIDYYKQRASTLNRVLRSGSWADKFKESAERFQTGKVNIMLALSVRATRSTDALHGKVDHILLMMEDAFKNSPSKEECDLLNIMNKNGGIHKFLDNEEAFKAFCARGFHNGFVVEKGESDETREKEKQAKRMWEEITQPLDKFLKEHGTVFDGKLELQTKELKSAIHQSAVDILKVITEGPHLCIDHPDIRELWKVMDWRLSVKPRHFVKALHDYYLHGLEYSAASSGIFALPPEPARGSHSALPAFARIDPADQWCLQFLHVRHHTAISEAFDKDGSGSISISEVNHFTAMMPRDWSLLRWMAYRIAGWATESWRYAPRIQGTLAKIADAQLHVRPHNVQLVNDYLNGAPIADVQRIVSSIQQPSVSHDPELEQLASSYRLQTEKALRKNLEIVKYTIDVPESVHLIGGPGGIEKYLLPLLHLLLKHHLDIVRFGRRVILDDREMEAALESLENVLKKVRQRVAELRASFGQQRLNVNEQLKCFACGIYSSYGHSLDRHTNRLRKIGLTPQPPLPCDHDLESSDDDSPASQDDRELPAQYKTVSSVSGSIGLKDSSRRSSSASRQGGQLNDSDTSWQAASLGPDLDPLVIDRREGSAPSPTTPESTEGPLRSDPSINTHSDPPPQAQDPTHYREHVLALYKALADRQRPQYLRHWTGRDLLAHANMTLDILDNVGKLRPFITVVTLPFQAWMTDMLRVLDGDKRVVTLMLKMIEMMSAFIELCPIQENDRQTASRETVQDNLTHVLTAIRSDIEDVGNLVDCYLKATKWERALRSPDWAKAFKDFVEILKRGKAKILQALTVRTALAADNMHDEVDHILSFMEELFKNSPSKEERDLLNVVEKAGGIQKILDSATEFKTFYQRYGSGQRTQWSVSGATREKPNFDESKEKKKEANDQWKRLKWPLAILIAENRSIFEAKLEVQMTSLNDHIRQSQDKLIRAIIDGPHGFIINQDIRDLWKEMCWRMNVKTHHFVLALHDYYLDDVTNSSASREIGVTPPCSSSDSSTDLEAATRVASGDQWCLQYLRIQYLPAISEALDDDGSGFVEASEVNDFTAGIPKDWTLLQWVAYWAAGWPTEIWRYAQRIQRTLAQIADARLHVKPENIMLVGYYVHAASISEIQRIVTSVQSPSVTPEAEMDRLASSYRSQTEQTLRENLEILTYHVDGPETVPVIGGPGRIEKYLLPLLYLLLERHLQIMLSAKEVTLDFGEMEAALVSLENVLKRVGQRVRELEKSFRRQKKDISQEFYRVAGGIYSEFQNSVLNDEPLNLSELSAGPTRYRPCELETSAYNQPWDLTEETTPWRPLNVKIGVVSPREMFRLAAQRVLERVQLLSPRLSWAYLERRRSLRHQWLEVALRSDDVYSDEASKWIPRDPPNWEVLEDLILQITPADVSYNMSLSELNSRRRDSWHGVVCDICHSEIVGKRFRCLNCPDFDLCYACEYAEPPRHDTMVHSSSHTMMLWKYPIEWTAMDAFSRRAKKYLVEHANSRCPCDTASSWDGGISTRPDSRPDLKCHGCGKELRNELHFRCLQCPDYDLCEKCEWGGPSGHCVGHMMLKLKPPFLEQDQASDESDDESEEEKEDPLSVPARLKRLTKRVDKMEEKLGGRLANIDTRLDGLQEGFTRAVAMLEQIVKWGRRPNVTEQIVPLGM